MMMMMMDKVTRGTQVPVRLQLAIPRSSSHWMTYREGVRHAAAQGPPGLGRAIAGQAAPSWPREDPGVTHRFSRAPRWSHWMTLGEGKQSRCGAPGPRSQDCEVDVLEELVTRVA